MLMCFSAPIILAGIAWAYVRHVNLPATQLFFLCSSIFLSNINLFACFATFTGSCQYLRRRSGYINGILEQMLFDDVLPENCELIDNNFEIITKDLNYINVSDNKKLGSNAMPNGITGAVNDQWMDPSKIKKRIFTISNKVTPVNSRQRGETGIKTNTQDIERVVQMFTLKDFKMLSRL